MIYEFVDQIEPGVIYERSQDYHALDVQNSDQNILAHCPSCSKQKNSQEARFCYNCGEAYV